MTEYILDEWRSVIRNDKAMPSKYYIVIAFPTDRIKEEYLEDISKWPESEIYSALGNMLGDSRGLNWMDREYYKVIKKYGPIALRNRSENDAPVSRLLTEYELRVTRAVEERGNEPVWPSLTWVLDLLPHFPRVAIDAISAYFLAHAQVLSDLRLNGLDDATAIIRYRYIVQDPAARKSKIAFLRSLDPVDIEYLAAALYSAMKYEVEITPHQKDGGVDVVASNKHEVIYIECKNWEERVNVETVRAFTAAVLSEPATKGVMISISGFTEKGPMSATDWVGAPMRRTRMELINGQKFVQLLNEFLGVDWNSKVDRIISSQKR